MSNIKKSILIRIFVSFGAVLIFALFIVWNIIKIQFAEGKKWKTLNDSLTITYKEIKAVRGNIYSDNGSLLATSVPIYEIRLDLAVINSDTFKKYKYELSQKLASKFKDKSYGSYLLELNKAKNSNNRYYLLKNKLSYLDIKKIRTWPIINKGRYKGGVIIEEDNYRVMPFKNLLTRTLGYTTSGKQQFKVGIEGAYNEELKGISGKRLVKKIAGGYIPLNDENEMEPTDGRDIFTTIDINIQDIVNNELLKGLKYHKAHHGCAILMKVKTGEIKAIANLTLSNDGEYYEKYNYAIGESYEPGSTFKLASALALIEKNKINLNDSVLINYGEISINKKLMTDAEQSKYKTQSFAFAFEHSSNVGISTAIQNSFSENPQEFIDYLKKLNLDKPLNIEIPGEVKPLIKNYRSKYWSNISLPWMSIGYEVKLTPLQILNLYNSVANNGTMLKPYLIKSIKNKNETIKEFTPQIISDKISDENTLSKIKLLLSNVVKSGTASNINNSTIKISGKTGTARISDGKSYFENEYYSSFAGYFPSDNPEYSIIVVVNRPKINGYYGGVVAAPIVKQIAEKIYGYNPEILNNAENEKTKRLSNLPDFTGYSKTIIKFNKKFSIIIQLENENNNDLVSIKKDSIHKSLNTKNKLNEMPDLLGMCLKDALFLLENNNIKVKTEGKGKVYWQSVEPGTNIGKGTIVTIKMQI